jgi:transcriptional regulator with XRE-family HTH domain
MKFPKPSNAALRPMALLIQGAMKQRDLSVKDVAKAMGLEARQIPAVYNWMAGKNGPGPEMRPKLAKVLGLTEAQLTSPLKSGSHGRPREIALGPAQRAVALVQQAVPGPSAMSELKQLVEPVRDVFSITGRSDGQISVRLQATLDAQRGMALARFLMDFGLIVGSDAFGESE